jgi:hypothetical protein
MYNMNLIYNPDHQQALEHHKELLKKAEHERPAFQAMKTKKDKIAPSCGLVLLRHLLVGRLSHKFVKTASQSSNAQT